MSMVDLGANTDPVTGDGAHIMLYKRADVEKGPDMTQTHVDTTDWRDDYEKATLDSASRNKLPDSAFAAVWTDSSGKKQRKLPIHDAGHLAAARGRVDGADIPASVKAEARRKIDAKTPKEKSVKKNFFTKFMELFNETDPAVRLSKAAELDKAFPDDLKDSKDDKDDDKDEDVTKVAHKPNDPLCKCADCMAKSMPPALADMSKSLTDMEKRYVALEKQNSNLAKSLQVEIDKRADSEVRDILKSFKATPFDLDKDVAVYRKMRDTDPVSFDRTITVMKAQDAMIASSLLMSNTGSGRSGAPGSAWAQIEAKADAAVEKAAGKVTREQAIEKIMLEHPELVAKHREERN